MVRDKDGIVKTVRYDAINAMLLNEFLKEHRKVAEQQSTITQLKSALTKQEVAIAEQRKDFKEAVAELNRRMEAVVSRFKEQNAKIQKVNDQVELKSAAEDVAVNKQ